MLTIIVYGLAILAGLLACWCLVEVGLAVYRWLREDDEDWPTRSDY